MAKPNREPAKKVKSRARKKATSKTKAKTPSRKRPRVAGSGAGPTRLHDADIEPFAVTASEIASLDDLQFRRFMGDLLRNEIAAYGGLAEELIGNPGDATDDGQDTETVRPVRATDTSDLFVPVGTTVWQFKAEKRAPAEASFRKELAKGRPQAVLGAAGFYRFVAQQPSGNETTKSALLKRVAGRTRARQVDFFAQARLAERARRFPALALMPIFRRPLERVHPYEWLARAYAATQFDQESRSRELAELVQWLRETTRPSHVRVVGPAGVGKTRLVLEALQRAGMAASTVYAANPGAGHFDSLFQWIATAGARTVLVVDECTETRADSLRRDAVDRGLAILLITIGHVEDDEIDTLPPDRRIPLEPMRETDVVRILQASTRIDPTSIARIAHITGGFIRLAGVVATAVQVQGNAFDTAALVRVDAIQQAVRSLPGVGDDALRWLSAIALFGDIRSDATGDDSEQAILATFVGVNVAQVGAWNRSAIAAQVLSDRGGRIFVTPTLLAVLLARDLARARKAEISAWIRQLPRRLQESFAAQLGQLRYSEEGRALASEIIGPTGPFGDLLAERQPWARTAFLALGSVARREALERLATWVERTPGAPSELATDGALHRLLFRLIWRPEHFSSTFALVLAGLDAAPPSENSPLRELLSGSLQLAVASSAAPFLERLAVASAAFRSDRHREHVRRSILRSLASGVGSPSGEGYSEDDVDVSGRDYWSPETYGEWWECARGVVRLLVDALGDRDEGVRAEAAANLIDHAASFIRHGAHKELLGAITATLAIDPRVGSAREELERVLAFDKVSPSVAEQVRAAIAALPHDLTSRMRMLVEGWELVDDREGAGLEARPSADSVAAEIMESAERDRLISMLFEPWARNAGPLLEALARHPQASAAWSHALDASRRSAQTWGVSLFLVVAHSSGNEAFRDLPTSLLSSPDEFDVHVGAEAITRMESNPEQVLAVASAVRSGRVKPEWLRYTVLGRWTERRSADVVAELIRAASATTEGQSIGIAMTHAAEENLGLRSNEVIELLASSMWVVGGHDAWNWGRVAHRAATQDPAGLARAILASIRSRHAAGRRRYERWADDEASQVLQECVNADQTLAVELLALWDVAPEFVESLAASSVVTHVDADALGAWATDERRQVALARMVPAAPHPLTEALLDRFGARSAFARRLRDGLFPRTWSGSLSPILESTRQSVTAWSTDPERLGTFRQWAREAAEALKKAIEQEKARGEDAEDE